MPAVGGTIGIGEKGKEYPGYLTRYVLQSCIIAAMGGLIFGYDIGISGTKHIAPSLIFFFYFNLFQLNN